MLAKEVDSVDDSEGELLDTYISNQDPESVHRVMDPDSQGDNVKMIQEPSYGDRILMAREVTVNNSTSEPGDSEGENMEEDTTGSNPGDATP